MTRRPPNVSWLGFTPAQAELLDLLDHLGNNAWTRTSQTEGVMPGLLTDCQEAGLSLARVKAAMQSVGYRKQALHELGRWESKRTTGKFGR